MLEYARLENARLELWWEDYCSEGTSSEGYEFEGGADGASSEGTDNGGGGGTELVESRSDVQHGTAVTAMASVVEAGVKDDRTDEGDSEVSATNRLQWGHCAGAREVMADVGGSAHGVCTVGGEAVQVGESC